ncbi:MAG: rhodanese-like domain-containing protein [Bacteroidota bacterium]|nr:rhodanese-like domain-containing protein [Bacteroidota bacterium]
MIEQIYTNCLFQASYYIESKGEVAIVDPLRDTEQYIEKAKKTNSKIKYIFETHIHADFVSGHITLSRQTKAPIVYGPKAILGFNCIVAHDDQKFTVGDLTIQIIHTPGHTIESTCLLIKNKENKEFAILTGDTLFLGDVGRPDLSHFRKENSYTKFELAEMLFKSLRDKIMPLNDDIIIYPGHGAGSACGKNMMNITYDTLKNQKKVNYALRSNMTQSEFINEVTFGLEKPPEYFPMNVEMNQYGYKDLNEVIKNSMKLLNPKEFDQIAKKENTIILDVRHQNDFVKGHIPGSIFIGLNGSFAPWVGSLIKNVNTQILIVSPKNKEQETILRLSRVGFDNVVGFLKGGFKSWNKKINYIESLDVEDIIKEKNKNLYIDVRAKNEFDNDHIDEFVNSPLTELETNINKFKNSRETIYINCAGGYRSVIAISILKKYGINNTIDIKGGYTALKNSNFSLN